VRIRQTSAGTQLLWWGRQQCRFCLEWRCVMWQQTTGCCQSSQTAIASINSRHGAWGHTGIKHYELDGNHSGYQNCHRDHSYGKHISVHHGIQHINGEQNCRHDYNQWAQTATHMTCPVPLVASDTYLLLGSDHASECSTQSLRGQTFSHLAFGACNLTQAARVALNFEEAITLICRQPSFGIVGSERNVEASASDVVVCSCTAPMTALAGSGPMEPAPEANIVGHTESKVSLDPTGTTHGKYASRLVAEVVLQDDFPQPD